MLRSANIDSFHSSQTFAREIKRDDPSEPSSASADSASGILVNFFRKVAECFSSTGRNFRTKRPVRATSAKSLHIS